MKRSLMKRVLVGIGMALPLILLSQALAHAQVVPQTEPPKTLDCKACHAEFQTAWEQGAHGLNGENIAFQQLGCMGCHEPVPLEHYREPMPVTRSSEPCGACHTQTYSGYRTSAHGQVGLDCVSCHDPHSTRLKAEDSPGLCASCHGTRVASYTHSAHYEQGLRCDDCHLSPLPNDSEGSPDQRDHSFAVDMSTCVDCHGEALHTAPVGVMPEPSALPMDAMGAVESDAVSAEPRGVNAATFAVLSGLIGMAAGMIAAPWMERWFRRARREGQ